MPQCTRSVSIRLSCKFSHSNIRQSFNKRLQVFQQVTPSSRNLSCRGNYDEENKCTVFRIPRKDPERSMWIQALSKGTSDVNGLPYAYSDNSFIGIHHWLGFPDSVPHEKIPSGSLRPTVPGIFFPKYSFIMLASTRADQKKKHQTSKNGKLIFSIPLTRSLVSTT